jgi:hypothetical protein
MMDYGVHPPPVATDGRPWSLRWPDRAGRRQPPLWVFARRGGYGAMIGALDSLTLGGFPPNLDCSRNWFERWVLAKRVEKDRDSRAFPGEGGER